MESGQVEITVATANVATWQFGTPRDVAASLKSADVAFFQEVQRGPNEDQFLVMADEFENLWQSKVHVTFTNTWETGRIAPASDFGNGIISRWPIDINYPQYSLKAAGNLPDLPHLQDRIIMQGSVDIAGRRVLVFNTHLPHNACMCRNSSERLNCDPGNREYMLEWISTNAAMHGGAAICGGDLNATRPSSEIRFIRSPLIDAWEDFTGGEFDYEELVKTVDYIFFVGFSVTSYKRVVTSLSDHPFVLATLQLDQA
jgi:endonuclease/exonuclease/phosphatase family metal-dependent hydrolase